ncbi:hypothetical protein EDC01DRAFT_753876 [Geopyxis carbonaria]|nr:hypothetical protein EDC01DRAFT_753876 [Geopyxis carbonaria]
MLFKHPHLLPQCTFTPPHMHKTTHRLKTHPPTAVPSPRTLPPTTSRSLRRHPNNRSPTAPPPDRAGRTMTAYSFPRPAKGDWTRAGGSANRGAAPGSPCGVTASRRPLRRKSPPALPTRPLRMVLALGTPSPYQRDAAWQMMTTSLPAWTLRLSSRSFSLYVGAGLRPCSQQGVPELRNLALPARTLHDHFWVRVPAEDGTTVLSACGRRLLTEQAIVAALGAGACSDTPDDL